MSTTTDGITPTIPPPSTATSTPSSAADLSSSDFIKLMITQLEQQDPTNPTDSNQILTQLSQISTLQSNTQMQTSLQGLTLQQSIGAGGNLIGKTVTGLDASGNSVTGAVSSVLVQNSQVVLQVTGTDANGNPTQSQLPMQNLTSIAAAAATTPAPTTASSAAATMQQLLSTFPGLATLLGAPAANTTSTTPTTSSSVANTLGTALTNILGTASAVTGGAV